MRAAASPHLVARLAKPLSPWEIACRLHLIAIKAAAIKAGLWLGSKFEAIVQPCWKFDQAHSTNQQIVYLMLQAIGRGEYHRGAVGGKARIFGEQLGEWVFKVEVSISALAFLTGLPVSTVAWAINQLIEKHSIRRITIRQLGQKGAGLREASIFILPHANDVLEARRNNPNIATTHGETDRSKSLNWVNGKANSRRLLTPAQAIEKWRVHTVPPRPTFTENVPTSEHAPPPAADKEFATAVSAVPVAATPPAAKLARVPVANISQKMKEKLTFAYTTREGGRSNTLTVQQRLDRLNDGNFCDLAYKIIENLEATAAAHGKVFPVTGVEEFCTFRLNERRDRKTGVLNVTYIGPFLVKCAVDNDKVLAYLDTCERRVIEATREARQSISECLWQLERQPNDTTVTAWRDTLRDSFPELWAEMSAQGDTRSAGAG